MKTNNDRVLNTIYKTTKSTLAKLLASENISVVYDASAKTASFEIVNRQMILPILKDMPDYFHDAFIGHEVAHAIYTNLSVGEIAKLLGETDIVYFNITEDARIERLIKIRYPGLRKDFNQFYTDLANDKERDFFGIAKFSNDLTQINFADRVNLHFKIGHVLKIPFRNNEEEEIIQTINDAETIQEAIEAAKILEDYCNRDKQQQQQQQSQSSKCSGSQNQTQKSNEQSKQSESEKNKQESNPSQSSNDQSNENESEKDEKESNENEKEESEESSSDNGNTDDGKGEDEEKEDSKDNSSNSEEKENQDESDQSSNSIEAEEENEEKQEVGFTQKSLGDGISENFTIANQSVSKNSITGYQPKSKNKSIKNAYGVVRVNGKQPYPLSLISEYGTFMNCFRPIIQMMVKEFNMRKAASGLQRTQVSKTGKVNPKDLAKYKFKNDIFRKNEVVSEDKNHGIVFVVDWSGSMSDHAHSVIKQLILLCKFCVAIDIPFEAYGFTGVGPSPKDSQPSDELKIDMSNTLFKIIDSSQKNINSKFMDIYCQCGQDPSKLHSMGGTPLTATAIHSELVIENFIKKYGTEKNNFVLLTDGSATDHFQHNGNVIMINRHTGKPKIIPAFDRSAQYLYVLENIKENLALNSMNGFYLSRSTPPVHAYATTHDKNKRIDHNEFSQKKSASIKNDTFDSFTWIDPSILDTSTKTNIDRSTCIFLKKFSEIIAS